MAYRKGIPSNTAAEVPYLLKNGLLSNRQLINDSIPNAFIYYVDDTGTGRIHWVQPADASNQTMLRNPNGVKAFAFNLVAMATPATPTITNVGTAGSTTDAYKIVAKNGGGVTIATTAASAAGSTTTANATLSATNYNVVTFANVTGAASYDIYRTTAAGTPSTTGKIGSVAATVSDSTGLQPTTYAFNDIGGAGDGTTAPTVNTSGQLFQAGITSSQLTTPNGVTATVNGTVGSTTISYKVVANGAVGTTAASSIATVTTANATLSAVNSVTVAWNPVPGAVSYTLYRTAAGGTPSTTGALTGATALGPTVTTFTDTGVAGDSTTPPTVNTTGAVTTGGGPVTAGALTENTTDQAIATNTVITAANMIEGILRCTTTATSTTDTAAAIVAQIPNCQVGSSFKMYVISASGQTHTLALGSGVTAASGVQTTLTTATVTAHTFLFRVTNVGTPAVVIYSFGAATS